MYNTIYIHLSDIYNTAHTHRRIYIYMYTGNTVQGAKVMEKVRLQRENATLTLIDVISS